MDCNKVEIFSSLTGSMKEKQQRKFLFAVVPLRQIL